MGLATYFTERLGGTAMQNTKTLRIPLSSLNRALAARARGAAAEDCPLRQPDPTLSPAGQAIDLLDCIDEALTWAEEPMQTAIRVMRSVPERAAALRLSNSELNTLVEACLRRGTDPTVDPRTLVPRTGRALISDLETIAAALDTACTRSRAAGKHVMRLALQAPALARRARVRPDDCGDTESRAATDAWLSGFSGRAKVHSDRARDGVGGLPAQAEMLRRRLLHLRVPRATRRRRSADTQAITQRLVPAPVA